MDEKDRYEAGLAKRKQVLGDAYVEAALTKGGPFNTEFQELITRYAWGEVWARPGLDVPTRRLLVLAITAAMSRWEEFRLHLRAALEGGTTPDDVKELLLQTAVYAGVPAANTGFHIAREVMAEIDKAKA